MPHIPRPTPKRLDIPVTGWFYSEPAYVALFPDPGPADTGQEFGEEVVGIWVFSWKGYTGPIDSFVFSNEDEAWEAAAEAAVSVSVDSSVTDLYDDGKWREAVAQFNALTPAHVQMDVALARLQSDHAPVSVDALRRASRGR